MDNLQLSEKEKFLTYGTIMLRDDKNIFSNHELKKLEEIADKIPFEQNS